MEQAESSSQYQILNKKQNMNSSPGFGGPTGMSNIEIYEQENDPSNSEFATLPKGVNK